MACPTVACDQVHSVPLSNGIELKIQYSREEVMDMKSTGATRTHRDDWWTGCSIWECSDVLASHLSAEPHLVRGRRVLELGSGSGLAGLAAGALGAQEVTLSDEVIFLAARNLDANFSGRPELHKRFKLRELRWGNKEQIAAAGPPFDLILASDCLYDGGQLDVFCETLLGLSRPGTQILIVTPDHDPTDTHHRASAAFYRKLREGGVEWLDVISRPPVAKKARMFMQRRFAERGSPKIVEMCMARGA